MIHTLDNGDPLPTPPLPDRLQVREAITDIQEGDDLWLPESGVQGWPSSWSEVYPQGRILAIGNLFSWKVGMGECFIYFRPHYVYWVCVWKGGKGIILHTDEGTILLPPSGGVIIIRPSSGTTYYNQLGYIQLTTSETDIEKVIKAYGF